MGRWYGTLLASVLFLAFGCQKQENGARSDAEMTIERPLSIAVIGESLDFHKEDLWRGIRGQYLSTGHLSDFVCLQERRHNSHFDTAPKGNS